MTEPTRRQRRKVLTDKHGGGAAAQAEALHRGRPRACAATTCGCRRKVRACSPPSRAIKGAQVWVTIGTADLLRSRTEPRRRARGHQAHQGRQIPPLRRHRRSRIVSKRSPRIVSSATSKQRLCDPSAEVRRAFESTFAGLGCREFAASELRHYEVARTVEDTHGVWVADGVLSRCVQYRLGTPRARRLPAPFVRGMKRIPPQNRKRSRILSDAELRKYGRQPKPTATFTVRSFGCCFSTATPSEKLGMSGRTFGRRCLDIPTAPREKGNPGKLRLPPAAWRSSRRSRALPATRMSLLAAARSDVGLFVAA